MMLSDSIINAHKPPVALTRIQREDLADQLYKARCPQRAFQCHVVDPETWQSAPESWPLVVLASTAIEARHAWERYAEHVGVTGMHRLVVTVTEPAKGRQREREQRTAYDCDLDLLRLHDELDEFEAADRAPGL